MCKYDLDVSRQQKHLFSSSVGDMVNSNKYFVFVSTWNSWAKRKIELHVFMYEDELINKKISGRQIKILYTFMVESTSAKLSTFFNYLSFLPRKSEICPSVRPPLSLSVFLGS